MHPTKTVLLPYQSNKGWVLDLSNKNLSNIKVRNLHLQQLYDQNTFSIDAIIGTKYSPTLKQNQYLIKWSGYTNEHNSWVTSDAIEQQLLNSFNQNPNSSYFCIHNFTMPYLNAYINRGLPLLYNKPIPIVSHTKYLGIHLSTFAPSVPFDLPTMLITNKKKLI